MTSRFVHVILCFLVGISFFIKANAANLITASPTPISPAVGKTSPSDADINSVRIICYGSKNRGQASRAVVLQMVAASSVTSKYDVAITTGHGLLGIDGHIFKDCRVNRPGGEQHTIVAAKLATGYKQGTSTDWAIIIFDKMKKNEVIRYGVGFDLKSDKIQQLATKQTTVLFSQALGTPKNYQACHLLPRQYAGLNQPSQANLLAHNCRAIAGQSGSPISIVREQQNIVLGIHIGHTMIYGHPTPRSPLRFQGYMRVVDQEFLEKFSEMFAELEMELGP